MDKNYLLRNETAKSLYQQVASLPIVDYHCHLSPKEIYENCYFTNIGELWLSDDHYKWRLMRTVGIDEYYITGKATFKEKFIKYVEALELAAGNPLYHWSHMELSAFFGINLPLNRENAEMIWEEANRYITENGISPRKLIEQSKVEIICTTDDIIDSLYYHNAIREDSSITYRVIPSFRTDNLLLVRKENYCDYIKDLSEISGVAIHSLSDMKAAVEARLQAFIACGCRYTDVGIPSFPQTIFDEEKAGAVYCDVLCGKSISDVAYDGLLGHLFVWLGKMYAKYGLVMQWHISVYRNSNSVIYQKLGTDCGGDCVGDPIPAQNIISVLNAINCEGGLPQTILYTLNASFAPQLASIAASFPRVSLGAAWWFCDTKKGIREQLILIAENMALGSFIGMLTDSRSFLSYIRHDYFRRILCSLIGEWVENNEYDIESAVLLL